MKIENFIQKRKHLIWYAKSHQRLSQGSVLEACLNYGDWNDFKTLLKILGPKKMASLFQKKLAQKRSNFSQKTANYFKFYFSKHA